MNFKNNDEFENVTPRVDDNQETPKPTVPYAENANQDSSEVQNTPSTSYPKYTSYNEWQEQQKKGFNVDASVDTEFEEVSKKKKGNKSKKPVYIVAGTLAAIMLFGSGTLIGLSLTGDSGNSANGGESTGQTNNSGKPTVNISDGATAVSSGDDGLSGEEIYIKVQQSVVSIRAQSLASSSGSSGSGVVMSEDGYIITNNHVVEGAEKISVVLSDGTEYPAEIIGLDKKTDLGVIKINPDKKLQPAEFGDSDKLQVGAYAFAIGSPGGVELQNSFTGGRISAINRDVTIDDRVMTLIQTDASINPGNSGGALINKYGQVVGITTAKLGISYYEGLGFAIPINSAKAIVDELIVNGYITGRPAIGISGYDITEEVAYYNQVPQGVMIKSIDTRSDAYAKGVKPGDIVIGVNGQKVTTMNEVNNIKGEFKAGEQITLNLYRTGTGKNVDVNIKLVDENDLVSTTVTTEQEQQQQQQQQYRSNNGQNFFTIP